MYLRHQTYTLHYRDVCILVFLHAFAYFMLLRCMLKFKRLACGSDDVTQYNTVLVSTHGTCSWLDHVVSSKSAHDPIQNTEILHQFILSDHRPVAADNTKWRAGRAGGPCCQIKNMDFPHAGELHIDRRADRLAAVQDGPVGCTLRRAAQ